MWLRPQPHRCTDWCVATSGREGAVKELWVVAWKIIAKARVTQAGNLWENCIPLLVGKNLGIALAGSILAWAAVTTWKVRHTFPDFTAALLVVSECLQTASCKYGQLWKSASNQSNHCEVFGAFPSMKQSSHSKSQPLPGVSCQLVGEYMFP